MGTQTQQKLKIAHDFSIICSPPQDELSCISWPKHFFECKKVTCELFPVKRFFTLIITNIDCTLCSKETFSVKSRIDTSTIQRHPNAWLLRSAEWRIPSDCG